MARASFIESLQHCDDLKPAPRRWREYDGRYVSPNQRYLRDSLFGLKRLSVDCKDGLGWLLTWLA
jgi:hypothetical protein